MRAFDTQLDYTPPDDDWDDTDTGDAAYDLWHDDLPDPEETPDD